MEVMVSFFGFFQKLCLHDDVFIDDEKIINYSTNMNSKRHFSTLSI